MKRIFLVFILTLFLTPTISFGDDNLLLEDLEPFTYTSQEVASNEEIIIYSKNIAVFDRNSKMLLFDKNSKEKIPIASTTKILTCIIALETLNFSENPIYTISQNAASATGSTLGLKYNKTISLQDLLYGLMLRSGNDCAILLAEIISGDIDSFSILMNKKAKELNLTNSNFTSPHGLDNDNHYSTAYDLILLTDYALNNPTFRKIVSCKEKNIVLNGIPTTIHNTNELLGNFEGIYGVKTGFTFNAGRCLISAYKNNDFDLIIAVLGANSKSIRSKDTKTLIKYINTNFKNLDFQNIINDSFEYFLPKIKNSLILNKTQTFPEFHLEKLSNYSLPININRKQIFKTKTYITPVLSYKTPKESIVGSLLLYNNNSVLLKLNIYLSNSLEKNSLPFYFKNFFFNIF